MSPGEIDERVVRRHLLALKQAVATLEAHAGRPLQLLRESSAERWVVERGLQLCAQNVLDIATHIAAAVGRDASDYASAIDVLAEVEVLPRAFVKNFRDVAGFRNVLVHGYLEVDLEILHRVLNARLREFDEFADQVEKYLASVESPRD